MSYVPGFNVWDDMLGDVSQGTGSSTSLVYEAFRDTAYLAYFFRSDAAGDNDVLNFRFQAPHRWNRGDVELHIHYVPMVDPDVSPEAIRFDGYYTWATIGGTIPLVGSWTPIGVTEQVVTGDAFKHKLCDLASITSPGPTTLESSFLLVRLRRYPSHTDDTYDSAKVGGTAAANVMLLGVDCHFQVNKLGTYTEIPV